MSKIPPVKGTRDFYPAEMAVRNWIIEGWKKAGIRNGFVEYDGPIFEYLQLYTQKSGDEIVEQLFSLQDRGGRDLAIRPEITPTLARMVNQQINALPRPIKWFSVPRVCRAERPQKGRLREFFQWNIDIVGSDAIIADAECIFTAVDYLRSVGLTEKDIVVKISNRKTLAALLIHHGFNQDQLPSIYALLDKRAKMEAKQFQEFAKEKIPVTQIQSFLDFLKICDDAQASFDSIKKLYLKHSSDIESDVSTTIEDLYKLFDKLDLMGLKDFYEFDINIVRGLAYYTGPVFEIFDRSASLRAICGGGRYDNLLAGLGGPEVPATGFGMGDVVLEILLREKNLIPALGGAVEYFVIDADGKLFEKVVEVVSGLRGRGHSAIFDYKRQNLGKQLKSASAAGAKYAVIIGQETVEREEVTLKNMETGEQGALGLRDLLNR